MSDITVYCYEQERHNSRQCLEDAAFKYIYGDNAEGKFSVRIAKTDLGKPFFPDFPDVFCSVTHSGAYWLGAFSGEPLGIDLQIYRPIKENMLACRFFHPSEKEYLKKHADEFFRVWTAKESYTKFIGTGIDENFCRFSVVEREKIETVDGHTQIRFVPFRQNYTLCLCAERIDSVTLSKAEIVTERDTMSF